MTTGGGAALPSPGLAITVDRTNKSDSARSDKLFILFQISAGPGRPGSQVSDDQTVDYNYSKVSKQIFHRTAGWCISYVMSSGRPIEDCYIS